MNMNLRDINLGIQNILDGQGIDIAITGMLVVFAALALISALISLLPIILKVFATTYPTKEEPNDLSEVSASPNDEVLAAIGFVLHTEASKDITDK